MLKTVKQMYDGCLVEVPIMPNGEPLALPYNGFNDFNETYCGPGEFGDAIVPDDDFGVPLNLACFIHDFSNALAENKEEDHQSNVMFRENMFAIIKHLEPQPTWEDKFHYARYSRALLYYQVVDVCGLQHD